jgi:hypothetical protein
MGKDLRRIIHLGRLNPEKGAGVWEVKNDELESPQSCYEGETLKEELKKIKDSKEEGRKKKAEKPPIGRDWKIGSI